MFEDSIVLPSLGEIAGSEALLRDFARHRVEDITRPHVLNHVLNSLSFYKLQAFSAKPFPGYR